MKVLMVFAVLMAVIAPLDTARAQTPAPPAGQQGVQIEAKSLIGSTVRGRDGKDVGKVSDVMLDPTEGRVNGVVISMGGVAGIGAKEITMPWNALQVGRDQNKIVVTLQQDPLQP